MLHFNGLGANWSKLQPELAEHPNPDIPHVFRSLDIQVHCSSATSLRAPLRQTLGAAQESIATRNCRLPLIASTL